MSATFGTTVPPTGLSGLMRRYAFRYSENHYFHWLILMMADRVHVVEGVVQDLGKGKVPNIFAEKGGRMQWKYNRTHMAKKLVIATAFAVTLYMLNKKRKKKYLLS